MSHRPVSMMPINRGLLGLIGLLVLCCPFLAVAGDQPAGDVGAGRLISRKCMACHDMTRAATIRLGPPLWNIVGRKVATRTGYPYSAELLQGQWLWSEEILDSFLSAPKAMVPGTRMVFDGLPQPEERRDLIAFLKTLR
ncbi:MAG: c-type cytochrome [Magnetococcales bacterium]|nr:c-type cytochrome [Magnetococcales bacterium]